MKNIILLGPIVALLLSNNVQALDDEKSYRPKSEESAPWHNFKDGAKARNYEKDPSWPHDYPVQNYGVD